MAKAGEKQTPEQKAERAVWRLLGQLTAVGYIDKAIQERLYYVKGGKFIRVEDFDSILCYKVIRDHHLEPLNMTVNDLEAWLVARGIQRKAERRVKRSLPLYD